MKKYISISKDFFEKVLDESIVTFEENMKTTQKLKQIQSIIDLSEEEIKILETANDILMKKIDAIEEVLEDKNNTFYDIQK